MTASLRAPVPSPMTKTTMSTCRPRYLTLTNRHLIMQQQWQLTAVTLTSIEFEFEMSAFINWGSDLCNGYHELGQMLALLYHNTVRRNQVSCAQNTLWERVMRNVSFGCRSLSTVVRNGQSCRSLPLTSMPSATGAKQEMLIASFIYMGLQAGWMAQVNALLLPCNALPFTTACHSFLPFNAAFQCCLSMLPFNAAFHQF